jgi:hypothetical protein
MNLSRRALASCLFLAILAILALPLAAQTSSSATYDASGAYWLLHHPRALARFLNLSAGQTTSLLGFWNTLQQTDAPLRLARGPLCQALATELATASPDPATVGTDTLAVYTNREALVAAHKTYDFSFSAILSPAQLVAYDTLKQIAYAVDPDYELIGDCPRQGS